jgi:HTH-type transcriptional regulator/antitoxin HipB
MLWSMTRRAYIADGLGERIRRLRQERGWTQTDLAERAGCSRRAIVYYERDGKYPPAPVLAAMAGAFGLDINTFMAPEEPGQKAAKGAPDLLTDPEDRRLWKKFRQLRELSERDQASVLRMLNALSGAKTAS